MVLYLKRLVHPFSTAHSWKSLIVPSTGQGESSQDSGKGTVVYNSSEDLLGLNSS